MIFPSLLFQYLVQNCCYEVHHRRLLEESQKLYEKAKLTTATMNFCKQTRQNNLKSVADPVVFK